MRYLVTAMILAIPLPLAAGKDTVFPPPVFVPELEPTNLNPASAAGGSAIASDGAIAGIVGVKSSAAAAAATAALTDATERRVTARFNEATTFCSRIAQREYLVDCFAYEYRELARDLDTGGVEGELREVIEETARKLETVVRQNRTNVLPPAVARRTGTNPKETNRPLRPVAPTTLPQANAEAASVIQEAQTVLLRSSENSERRRAQFQRVVASMETGTILLRSL